MCFKVNSSEEKKTPKKFHVWLYLIAKNSIKISNLYPQHHISATNCHKHFKTRQQTLHAFETKQCGIKILGSHALVGSKKTFNGDNTPANSQHLEIILRVDCFSACDWPIATIIKISLVEIVHALSPVPRLSHCQE